jgi:hypothetical protein
LQTLAAPSSDPNADPSLSAQAAKSTFLRAPQLAQLPNRSGRLLQRWNLVERYWDLVAAGPTRDGNPNVIGDAFGNTELEQPTSRSVAAIDGRTASIL